MIQLHFALIHSDLDLNHFYCQQLCTWLREVVLALSLWLHLFSSIEVSNLKVLILAGYHIFEIITICRSYDLDACHQLPLLILYIFNQSSSFLSYRGSFISYKFHFEYQLTVLFYQYNFIAFILLRNFSLHLIMMWKLYWIYLCV